MLSCAALLSAPAFLATPGNADNWGSTGAVGAETNVSFGNNDNHKVDLVSITSEMAIGVRDILAYYSFVTGGDLVMTEVSGTADVNVVDANLGYPGPFGKTNCPGGSTTQNSNPFRTCFTQLVTLNQDWGPLLSSDEWTAVACHELGHSVGLRHTVPGAVACLNDDISFPNVNWLLRPHDVDVLQYFY